MKQSILLISLIFCLSYGKNPLSELSEKYGADKGPSYHNYTSSYHLHFSNYRNSPIKFLEIGFLYGASARMWQDYFPYAQLFFMDIKKDLLDKFGKDLSERCHLYLIDQGKPEQLRKFIQDVGSDFDIIVDDGGHTMTQQITSFKELFPHVRSGGIYVIEDLQTSYLKEWGGYGTSSNPKAGRGTTIQFLKNIIDDLNYVAAKIRKADKEKCPAEIFEQLNYYQKNIRSIHFYDALCFIYKR